MNLDGKNELNLGNSIYHKALARIYEAESLEEIIRVFNETGLSKHTLKAYVLSFSQKYNEKSNEVYDKVMEKIAKYSLYLSEVRKRESEEGKITKNKEKEAKKIELATRCINDFLGSKLTLDEFLEVQEMDLKSFLKKIEILKEINEDLYKACEGKINYYLAIEEAEYSQILENFLNCLRDPNFDIIDYYTKFDCDLQKLRYYAVKLLDMRDIFFGNAIRFLSSIANQKSENRFAEKVMDVTMEINMEKDKDGFPIKGTGYVIPDSTKEKIFQYFEQYNIPKNSKLFNIAMKKYFNGELVKEETIALD